MKTLEDIEKLINSELTSKINSSKINHGQIYLNIDETNILDVILFLKTNKNTSFKQLIDITAVDYPSKESRFELIYIFLSMVLNERIILKKIK